ncbi:hypothetical protein C0J52_18970, partial [Blattella germanica]
RRKIAWRKELGEREDALRKQFGSVRKTSQFRFFLVRTCCSSCFANFMVQLGANNSQNVKYIYDLPYFARKDLCRLLDQMEMWEELAGKYMEFDMMMIQDLRREERRGASPTDELLTLWGHKNHTVLELFALLSKMQHYQAMLILKPFEGAGTENSGGAAGADLRSDGKHLDVGSHNFNNSESNNLLQSKVTIQPNQQPEIKILNTAGMPAATENKENMNPRLNGTISPAMRENVLSQNHKQNASDISSIAENCGSVPHIDFQELVTATSNWSKRNILGKGGFGTVYKGDWKNTQVAVKRIEQKGAESAESHQVQLKLSLRELQVLNSFRHDNILPLYGFSFNGDERANILLDVNFIPRIGDFGLAREGPQDNLTHMKVSRVYGTRPYLPDEFLRGKQMSTKVDTFSFGITMIDNKIPKDVAIFYHLMLIGKKCISKLHRNRPEMDLVLKELEQPPQSK